MLWIWAVPLGQPPCKLAGVKRKSSIILKFKIAPGIAQHLEEFGEREYCKNSHLFCLKSTGQYLPELGLPSPLCPGFWVLEEACEKPGRLRLLFAL